MNYGMMVWEMRWFNPCSICSLTYVRASKLYFISIQFVHSKCPLLPTTVPICKHNLRLDLLLEGILQRNGISGKLADTLTQFVDGHWVLVEIESEGRLVVNVGLLLDI